MAVRTLHPTSVTHWPRAPARQRDACFEWKVLPMIRMEIALFLVLVLVAIVYFSAGKKEGNLHRAFSGLLILTMVNLVFDGITVYTVNRLDTVPLALNDFLHHIFLATLVGGIYLFYVYVALLVEEETGNKRRFKTLARGIFVVLTLMTLISPVRYTRTPAGNYSDGLVAYACYLGVGLYLLLSLGLLIRSWPRIRQKRRAVIITALLIELVVAVFQAFHHDWLISGMGLTLMCMAVYLTLENPDLLRGELTEQRLSMLYFKSQINPHFLYNTLDTIRIQAQLNSDPEVAGLLMRLVDFFRLTVKVVGEQVPLEDELELLDAYLELICARYPQIQCQYEIDDSLEDALVPNFILQPIVENSVLHGLKNKGYRGTVRIRAGRVGTESMLLEVADDGAGFPGDSMERMNRNLREHARQSLKLEGNSIGVLNVQKRIKLLCGGAYGLQYERNEMGGTTAKLLLPIRREEGRK